MRKNNLDFDLLNRYYLAMVILSVLIFLIALLHIFFLILEMFLWTKPLGLRAFHQTYEKAQATKRLAANQGLYNGFLAAGLIWSTLQSNFVFSIQLKYFFLTCVAVAGLFGAKTVHRKIFFIQALPALIAMVILFYINL